MSLTAIIDYGVGNLYSLSCSLNHIGCESVVTGDADVILGAKRVILPGVGAFADAMEKLKSSGLIPALDETVRRGKPLLGICLGMQLLFEKSYEFGEHAGLGYIRGEVCPMARDLAALGLRYKIPQMGWNSLTIRRPDCAILADTSQGEFMYFVHSFYAKGCARSVAADTEYGVTVPAVAAQGSVYGCQFHPEKSGGAGLKILRAFARL